MNPLEDLKPEELIELSDQDFQEVVRKHAKGKTAEAMRTIQEVMTDSDDDQARLLAANKMLKLAKAEEEETSALPFGISEEVFLAALSGLGKLASIAQKNQPSSILRNVTPAKADPRKNFIPDDSPLNTDPKSPDARLLIEENLSVEE